MSTWILPNPKYQVYEFKGLILIIYFCLEHFVDEIWKKKTTYAKVQQLFIKLCLVKAQSMEHQVRFELSYNGLIAKKPQMYGALNETWTL